ncbi:TetR/AcrR family transcriptional regulator [uncultured Bifidobacterium sp.]|uniref:TetR/AcrR family transcriptional regulator n=1 Tax=uncultured Bifidobacterium sp. TaxID=165187 RepID=UPI0028DB4CD8|nr:TetR/AcrR family transcriptional regulator [uncultured Bifidobacterium sp.]
MTSYQRREQLIAVGRSLFAAKGFEAVSVEEIAANAKVSKPIVYEHFGGKEGLYAVVVDREMRTLTSAFTGALSDTAAHPRQIVERAALALLTYIEENAEGFQVLVRDSPSTDPAGSFSSLLGDVSLRVEQILGEWFRRQHLPSKGVPYYAQMLVGLTVFTGQYWADRRKISKEQLAAHIVNLAWHGLSRLEGRPELRYEGERARRNAEKAARDAQRTRESPGVDPDPKGEADGASPDDTAGGTTNDTTNAAAEEPDARRTEGAEPRHESTGSTPASKHEANDGPLMETMDRGNPQEGSVLG